MTIDFVGNHYTFGRVPMGWHSFDDALKGDDDLVGFPTRTFSEFYGMTGIGKSTLIGSILSKVSQALEHREIACLALEMQDEKMVSNVLSSSGYRAKFVWVEPPIVSGKLDDSDEALLGVLLEHIHDEPYRLGWLDSIASISPISENEGNLGDANMGRRAFPMAQFSRRVTRALRNVPEDSCLIAANHWYEKMGAIGMAKQYTSPGGVVKENEEHLRIQLKVPWVDYISSGDGKAEARWETGWVLEGKVEKNRAGAKNKRFQVFIYGGWGVHMGMTAVIDCLASGLAKIKSGKIVMDDYEFGNLKKIIERERDNTEFFIPFINKLREGIDTVLSEDDGVVEETPKKKRGK